MSSAGCVPTYSVTHDPAPSVVEYLPSDLRTNTSEVLVVAQSTTEKTNVGFEEYRELSVFLMKASELQSLDEELYLSTSRVFRLHDTPTPRINKGPGSPIELGDWDNYLEARTDVTLDLVCVVAPDGRTFRFSPNSEKKYDLTQSPLTARERDSFLQVWPTIDADLHSEIPGPCGTKGMVDWNKTFRTRALNFVRRIPVRSSPAQHVTSAQGVTHSPNPPANGALIAPGASWIYEFREKIYGENDARITVRVLHADGQSVEEQLTARVGATRTMPVRRNIDARSTSFDQYRLGASEEALTEFAPYLFAAGGEQAVRDVTDATGYPTSGDSGWVTTSAPPVWEKVTVPAGTFRALHFVIRGHREVRPFSPIVVYRFEISVWYAPEVKRYVRLEHKTWLSLSKPNSDEVVELVKFNPPS